MTKNTVPVRKLNVAENIEMPTVESMVMYQNVAFVAAAGSQVGRVVTTSIKEDDKIKRSFKRSKFAPSVAGQIDLGMRTNAILGAVSVLSEVGEDFDGVLAVYVNDAVANDFNDGSAHRIVATGLNNRKEVPEEEITAWVMLSQAISALGFLRVRVLPISEATLREYDKEAGKKVRIEEDSEAFKSAPGFKQFNHKMAGKAWDLVQTEVRKKADRLEEVIEEDGYDDDKAV